MTEKRLLQTALGNFIEKDIELTSDDYSPREHIDTNLRLASKANVLIFPEMSILQATRIILAHYTDLVHLTSTQNRINNEL